VICPSCSTENADTARFCNGCGALLTPEGTGRDEERKIVSVLFCDLVGFTAASEGADPEDVRARIRPYHATLRQELERYGGTVEKFIGDAVMAVWGTPTATEDDAERAVRAALDLVERHREGRHHRLFFAQREAAETVIFLTEARGDFLQGIEIPPDEQTIHFSFPQPKPSGRIVAEFKDVSKSYGPKTVFSGTANVGDCGHRVAACGNILASNVQVRVCDQGGGIIGAGPPYFAVRHQSAKYLAAFHARTRIIRLDGLTVAELALRLGRRAGTLARVLGTGQHGKHGQQENDDCDSYLHESLLE
jgi:hypothetical protein